MRLSHTITQSIERFKLAALAAVLGISPMSIAAELQVQVTPRQDRVILNEPVELELALCNNGDDDLLIYFDYPGDTGIVFTSDDPDAVSPPVFSLPPRSNILKLKAGQILRRTILLNRFLQFTQPKCYTVNFKAQYAQPLSDDNDNPMTFTTNGQFDIVVNLAEPNREWFDACVAAIGAKDPVRAEEATEKLLWTDDPAVMDPLVYAADRLPDFGADIVRSLARFFDQDHAKMSILEVAHKGNANALAAALEVFDRQQTTIPKVFYHSVLSSGHTGKVFPTLEYLVRFGGQQHLELVEPFLKADNPEIQKVAMAFVDKLSH